MTLLLQLNLGFAWGEVNAAVDGPYRVAVIGTYIAGATVTGKYEAGSAMTEAYQPGATKTQATQ